MDTRIFTMDTRAFTLADDDVIPTLTLHDHDFANMQTTFLGYDQPAHDDGHVHYNITNRDWQDDLVDAVRFYYPSAEITLTPALKQLMQQELDRLLKEYFSQFCDLDDLCDNPDDIYRLGAAAKASANPVITID